MPQILHVHICLGSVNLQHEKKFLQTMNVGSQLNWEWELAKKSGGAVAEEAVKTKKFEF